MEDRQSLLNETRPYVWLKIEYARLKKKNPRYSLRAFAKTLNIPSGRLSEYLSAQRQITLAAAEQICTKLKFEEELTKAFLHYVKLNLERKKGFKKDLSALGKSPKFDFIGTDSQDRYRIVADWHYFAILSLLKLDDAQSSVKWISKKLGLPEPLVIESLDRLQRLEFLDLSTTPWEVKAPTLRTTDGVASVALMEFHLQNLKLAQDKLETVPVEDRDYSAITIAIDKDKLTFAKGMIRDFRRKLSEILEAGESKSDVYRLSIQFFPLNQRDPK